MGSSENLETTYAAFESIVDRELWLVTASDGAHLGGLIATFVSPASIVPGMPRMLAGVARQHRTWDLIEASGAFALHLLGEEHLDWVARFGLQSGRAADKFRGLEHRPGRSGSPILTEAAGWLDCRVEARLDAGDRTIYLAEVLDAVAPRSSPVLTIQRTIRLVPDPVRERLAASRRHDAAVDAELIRAWRQAGPNR